MPYPALSLLRGGNVTGLAVRAQLTLATSLRHTWYGRTCLSTYHPNSSGDRAAALLRQPPCLSCYRHHPPTSLDDEPRQGSLRRCTALRHNTTYHPT